MIKLQEALKKSMIDKLEKHTTFCEDYYIVFVYFGENINEFEKFYKDNKISDSYRYIFLIEKDEMKKYMIPKYNDALIICEITKKFKSLEDLKGEFSKDKDYIEDYPIKQIWPIK